MEGFHKDVGLIFLFKKGRVSRQNGTRKKTRQAEAAHKKTKRRPAEVAGQTNRPINTHGCPDRREISLKDDRGEGLSYGKKTEKKVSYVNQSYFAELVVALIAFK